MRVLHIITGLDLGGAETMMLKLLSATAGRVQSEVISLSTPGLIAERIEDLNVRVRSLHLKPSAPNPASAWRLFRMIAAFQPNLVQTWMYHADLLGGLAAAARGVPVVWNLRNSRLDLGGIKWTTRALMRVCALLSGLVPRRIICGSHAAYGFHASAGYRTDRMIVIPNGFDTDRFRPDEESRISLRKELGLTDDAVVIGLVARFDPLKDHRNFIRAAGLVRESAAGVHFVLAGEGVSGSNALLAQWIDEARLSRSQVHLLGRRLDIPRVVAAFDIACLSSYSEGFPNVVGEAMACGVPCVVTDVGDASDMVGTSGIVVPARDPAALARGCLMLIEAGAHHRRALGEQARKRVESAYSIDAVADSYLALYAAVARERRSSAQRAAEP